MFLPDKGNASVSVVLWLAAHHAYGVHVAFPDLTMLLSPGSGMAAWQHR